MNNRFKIEVTMRSYAYDGEEDKTRTYQCSGWSVNVPEGFLSLMIDGEEGEPYPVKLEDGRPGQGVIDGEIVMIPVQDIETFTVPKERIEIIPDGSAVNGGGEGRHVRGDQ